MVSNLHVAVEVSNLPPNTTRETFKMIATGPCDTAGEWEFKLAPRPNRRGIRYGHVFFNNVTQAEYAIESFRRFSFDGYPLTARLDENMNGIPANLPYLTPGQKQVHNIRLKLDDTMDVLKTAARSLKEVGEIVDGIEDAMRMPNHVHTTSWESSVSAQYAVNSAMKSITTAREATPRLLEDWEKGQYRDTNHVLPEDMRGPNIQKENSK